MLIITRREKETVVLRDRKTNALLGTVTVTSVRGDRARVGFTFPSEIVVDREEVDMAKNPAEGAAT